MNRPTSRQTTKARTGPQPRCSHDLIRYGRCENFDNQSLIQDACYPVTSAVGVSLPNHSAPIRVTESVVLSPLIGGVAEHLAIADDRVSIVAAVGEFFCS
jgi:hypothetical protein